MRFSVKLVGALFAAIIVFAVLVATVVRRGDRTTPDSSPLAVPAALPGSTQSIGRGPDSSGSAASTPPDLHIKPDLTIKKEPVHPSLERFGVPMSAEAPAREGGSGAPGQTARYPQGPGVSTGSAGEAGPISEPFNIDDPGLPPEITDPIVSGPPPEASDPGIDYPAPEASDPGISYPAPEDSDPGIEYPSPEDSLPDPTMLPSAQNP